MSKTEYLWYALENEFPNDFTWITDMFSILADENHNDEYVKIDNNKIYAKQDDNLIEIGEFGKPIFTTKEKITIDKNMLNLVDKPTETTVGRLIMNYLIIYQNFGHKIPYLNKQFGFEEIESNYIEKMLVDNDKPDKGITVSEYKNYMDTMLYIMNFNKVISVSITEKTSLPPKGIEEYKKQVIKELEEKYGPNALEDKAVAALFEEKMMEYDEKWLKGDPAEGKFVVGKIKGARKKMFIDYGVGMDFKPTNKAKVITQSLLDGYPKDPEKLAVLFNDSRLGSYSRGAETQKGGVAAKVSLRATNDIKVLNKDCKTKMFLFMPITKNNYKKFINRYMFNDKMENVLLTEDLLKSLIGDVIKLRSPLYCNEDHHYCVYCMGKGYEDKENAISLAVSGLSGKILNESMKRMHATLTEVVKFNIHDELS